MRRLQNILAATGIVVLLFVLENKKLVPQNTTQILSILLLTVLMLGQILFRGGVYQPHNWRFAIAGIGIALMPLVVTLSYAWWKIMPIRQLVLSEGLQTTAILLVTLTVGITIGKKIK